MPQVVFTYALADPSRELGVEGLQALTRDLIAHYVVDRPCGLVVGHPVLPVFPSLLDYAAQTTCGPFTSRNTKVTTRYLGGSSAELLAAIADAPLGKQDVTVWFRGFAENAADDERVRCERVHLWGVALCVFAEPREIELEQGNTPARVFLTAQGEGGPWPEELEGTTLTKVLENHLGTIRLESC